MSFLIFRIGPSFKKKSILVAPFLDLDFFCGMGIFQSRPAPDVRASLRGQNFDEAQRAEAIETLDRVAQTYSGAQSSVFGELITLMAHTRDGTDRHDTVTAIVELRPRLDQASSMEVRTFKNLVNRYPIILQDMTIVVLETPAFGLGVYVDRRFKMIQIAHDYYDVTKEYLFLLVVNDYGSTLAGFTGHRLPVVEIRQQTIEAINEWVRWSMDKSVVSQLVTGKALAKQFLDIVAPQVRDIFCSAVMKAIYGVLPFNIAHLDAMGYTSLKQIVENVAPPEIQVAVSVIYPAWGTSLDGIELDESLRWRSIEEALHAEATVKQINQLLPVEQSPLDDIHDMVIYKFPIYGRLDLMIAYGFGPEYQSEFPSSRSLQNFLAQCRVDIRDQVLVLLGLSA